MSAPIELASAGDATAIWILLCGFLVFWMHAGFSMLEAGSVRAKNAINIMFKNVGTVCIGAIAYFCFGYAFAYGPLNAGTDASKFIGSGHYFMAKIDGEIDRNTWFFQFAFAATGATIVSGAVAGRVKLTSYFIVATIMTAWIYPVVSHWVWSSTGGWLSAFIAQEDRLLYSEDSPAVCGMIDYAGSGVVHMTGGVAAFWGALIVGPRTGRFVDGKAVDMPGHNFSLCTLGTFILWFGWFGFNCGSTLAFDGYNASKVAVTTTLSPSAAALTGMVVSKLMGGDFDLTTALNCVLGGLVSITAGCSTVSDAASIAIGAIGGLVYIFASKFVLKIAKIDDPVDAIAVHGFCGLWGCLAVGIFANSTDTAAAYPQDGVACEVNGSATQFLVQLIGVIAITAWVSFNSIIMFMTLKKTIGVRVSEEEEELGLDASEHGNDAYTMSSKV